MKATLHIRLSAHDVHSGGNLVDGARVLGLFGDVGTERSIRSDERDRVREVAHHKAMDGQRGSIVGQW